MNCQRLLYNPKILGKLFQETFKQWQQDKASRLAAALAYYTVFSLSPLLIIVVAIAGFFFGEAAARGEIVAQIQDLVGREAATVIQAALENAGRPNSGAGLTASLISIGVLLFGATSMFAQLQDALNTIWDVAPRPNTNLMTFIRKRVLSFAMVVGVGFLLLVSLVVSAGLAAMHHFASHLLPGWEALWQIVELALSFGAITLLFAMIYKFLPDVRIQWSDVWVGAALTTGLFIVGKFLLGVYLGNSSFGSTYGAAGSLVIILAWVYYSVQILFFGAEFTQVYARRYGTCIQPSRHAVPLSDTARAQQGIPDSAMLEAAERRQPPADG